MMFERSSKLSKAIVLSAALALSLSLSACSGGGMGMMGGKVATVNGTVITRADYDKAYKQLAKSMKIDLANIADAKQKEQLNAVLKQMTVQKLVVDTLMEQEAKTLGLVVSDQEVQTMKGKELTSPERKAEFKKFLDESLMSEKDFDNMLKHSLLMQKVAESKTNGKGMVSDAEVSKFFSQHPEQFNLPEQLKVSHIIIKAIPQQLKLSIKSENPRKSEAELNQEVEKKLTESKTKIDSIYAQIKADPNKFAELAKANSEDGSAAQGGDLGYITQQNIDPVFWTAAKKTGIGKLYPGVLQTQFGFHILKVEDAKAPKKQTLAEAKPMIQQYLEQNKKNEILMGLVAERKKVAKIELEPEFQPEKPQLLEGGAPGGVPMQQPQQH